MGLLDDVIQKCKKIGRMKYNSHFWGWEWIEGGQPPLTKGVYFLISSEGIEKVGSARGRNGMKRRFADYVRRCSRLRTEDRTCVLWDRIMTSEMQDVAVDVYCIEANDTLTKVNTPLGEVEVESSVILGLEAYYFNLAMAQNEPMRLCGSSP